MKLMLAIALLAICASACRSGASKTVAFTESNEARTAAALSEDEKHRLYSAALAASESPLDTDEFKNVCRRIGIFDVNGNPNDKYLAFVSQHVEWGMKAETDQFRHQIDTREKARAYINEHSPR